MIRWRANDWLNPLPVESSQSETMYGTKGSRTLSQLDQLNP